MHTQIIGKAPMKGQVHSMEELVNCIYGSTLKAPLLKKPTGEIQLIVYEVDEGITNAISSFDNFILVLDGKAIITVEKEDSQISLLQCIIIPSHSIYSIKAVEQFKALSVVIKSGYE
jgi:quercetin dioxygenase-like cupin family protein